MVKSTATVQLKPVGEFILLQFFEEREQSRRGVVIPDHAQESPREARVLALGTGQRGLNGELIPFDVHEGDRVLVAAFGTIEVVLEDVKFNLARSSDILGVLK